MTRGQAKAVMGVVAWVGVKCSRELWRRRCEIEVEGGRCPRQEGRRVVEEIRAEGMRVAGVLG